MMVEIFVGKIIFVKEVGVVDWWWNLELSVKWICFYFGGEYYFIFNNLVIVELWEVVSIFVDVIVGIIK